MLTEEIGELIETILLEPRAESARLVCSYIRALMVKCGDGEGGGDDLRTKCCRLGEYGHAAPRDDDICFSVEPCGIFFRHPWECADIWELSELLLESLILRPECDDELEVLESRKL